MTKLSYNHNSKGNPVQHCIYITENPRISKGFFRSLEQLFLTVGQNNFGNKILIIADTLEVNIMILQETTLLKLHISINDLYLATVKVTKYWPIFHFKSTVL